MTDTVSFWEQFSAPIDISTNGHKIDYLFQYTTVLNIFFFILVCAGLFGFVYLYHEKRHRKPLFTYGNKKSQVMLATVIGAAVFLLIDLNITRMANNDLVNTFWNWPKKEENPLRIEIMAQQWMWNFRYAGADNVFNTRDDVVLNHELHIPKGRKVVVRMTSKDVIHSFFIPNVRQKVDAIPGRVTQMWFDANRVGEYDIACAEMCGAYHFMMKAKLVVHEPEDFKTWQEQARSYALESNDPENFDHFWGWPWDMKQATAKEVAFVKKSEDSHHQEEEKKGDH